MVTDAAMSSCKTTESGVRVGLADGQLLEAELMLVAVGRGPQTTGLGYQEMGVDLEDGFVKVNERLETSVPGVYAVGDLVRGLQLAHRGFAHGIFVAEDIAHRTGSLEQPPATIVDLGVPRVTYSDPEIASIGLSENEARTRFGEVETFTYDLAGNGKSQILKTRGFVKLVRQPSGPVVGIHMIGARVSELVGEAQLITNWDAFPVDVAGLIHAHPSQSEALGEAHLALAGKPLHSHA
jgi:dihydrolipoamide dehydrogenase